tara:strand:- start:3527 stop:5320 length:1794 start_codon:yes stop_codon:yes gene_type:complete
MADPSFNFDPSSSFNFEPSPSFSFSNPGVNPMMQSVPILGQQSYSAPEPALQFDPSSLFNVEPSPSFNFNPPPSFNFNPVTEADLVGTDGMSASQIVDMINQPDYQTPSLSSDGSGDFSFGQFLLPGLIGGGAPAVMSSASGLAPTGQIVPSFNRPMVNVTGSVPQLSLPGSTAAAAAGASKLARFGSPGTLLYGGADLLTELATGRSLSERIGEGIGEPIGNFLFPGAQNQPAFTNAGTLAELAEMSAPSNRSGDPIRATYQSGGQTVMERESGETFVPSASQLESFKDFMKDSSQATATGIGLGGSEGVSFGGGRAPMGRDATKARIAELSGLSSPATLNQAITNNPNAVMATDAQGRMRSFASPQARQQNLANAQAAFNQESLNRQIRGGGTGSYAGDSAARVARVNERDKRPGETQTQRDTRIADSRTEGADRGGEMSFAEARKFVPKGAKEKTKDYNERVKAYQAQQNSNINKLKERYEEYRTEGQKVNNAKTNALIAKYQQTQPEKYRDVLEAAQGMLQDGILQDETQMAMYIVDQMGGKVSSIFSEDPNPDPVKDQGGQLDKQTAMNILEEAGGDVEEARRIARERGFVL